MKKRFFQISKRLGTIALCACLTLTPSFASFANEIEPTSLDAEVVELNSNDFEETVSVPEETVTEIEVSDTLTDEPTDTSNEIIENEVSDSNSLANEDLESLDTTPDILEGWHTDDDGITRYYLDGNYCVGFTHIGDDIYYFNNNGKMETGWAKIDGRLYNFGTNGIALIGFNKIGSYTYWFDANGKMETGWAKIDDRLYWFNSKGRMETGWAKLNGRLYNFGTDGAALIGFNKIGNYTYWFDSKGRMETGWAKIDGKLYWFDKNGRMETGWAKLNGRLYNFGTNGAALTGFNKIGSYIYWFDSKGRMETGFAKINGSLYWFDKNGRMETGWAKIGNYIYYFGSNGKARTGYEIINNKLCRFDKNGRGMNGWATLNGDKYYFNNGKCTTGITPINGKHYLFDPDGRLCVNSYVIVNDIVYFGDEYGIYIPNAYAIDIGEEGYLGYTCGDFSSEVASYLYVFLNSYRSDYGLNELVLDDDLGVSAFIRSAETSYDFNHTRPNGQPCFSVHPKVFGENICMFPYYNAKQTAISIMNAWINSPGHNQNMLDSSWGSCGIGVFITDDGYAYAVQLFGL